MMGQNRKLLPGGAVSLGWTGRGEAWGSEREKPRSSGRRRDTEREKQKERKAVGGRNKEEEHFSEAGRCCFGRVT